MEEPIPEPTLDALAGYEDEARLHYTGGLSEIGTGRNIWRSKRLRKNSNKQGVPRGAPFFFGISPYPPNSPIKP